MLDWSPVCLVNFSQFHSNSISGAELISTNKLPGLAASVCGVNTSIKKRAQRILSIN